MKLYTKGGDQGRTSLIGGERTDKCDPRVEAYGSVDELTAFIALLGDKLSTQQCDLRDEIIDDLRRVNSILMSVEALLAVGEGGESKVEPIDQEHINWIERRIDLMQTLSRQITYFTIPGGCEVTSLCHVCRTVARRAERAAIKASKEYTVEQTALIFLNRLSDYLYALGRFLCEALKANEIIWKK